MKPKCVKCRRNATVTFSRTAYFVDVPVARAERVVDVFCTQHGNDMMSLWSSSIAKKEKFKPALVKI